MSRLSLYGASLAAALLPLLVTTADAAILTVGASGGGCNHTTVQAAVNAANTSPGADEIRIARSATWTAQQITVNTNEEIRLAGGYATCASPNPDGTRTVLSGAGGDARPVLTIRGNGFVFLRGLTIRDGDQGGDDNGGGINFSGGGILDIADSLITANTARDGAGIYATGTTITAEVILGANVNVSFNIARNSGGGMVSKSLETSITGPGTTFMFNEARGQNGGGYGGGLVVVSEQFPSYAYISSNGQGGVGVLYANQARYGGGIAVLGGTGSGLDADARFFSSENGNPVRINANTASIRGGGVYLKSDSDDGAGDAYAFARLWNAAIADNSAPDGAAAYLDYDESTPGLGFDWPSAMYFNDAQGNIAAPPGAVACTLDRPCGYITGNTTGNTTGAIIRMPRSSFEGERIEFSGNTGGRLFQLTNSGGQFEGSDLIVNNSLMVDNTMGQELIRLGDNDDASLISMSHVTIAGNTLGSPHVISAEGTFWFDRSLVAQPGKTTLASTSGDREIEYVLSNDTTNMQGSFFLINPRFIDPANGDYRLRAGSYAVDFAPDDGGRDVGGRPHTIDMPNGGIQNRTADVGAHERLGLQPLVLNNTFDSNLAFWTGLSDSFWDSTTNAAGLAGSGSVRIPYVIDPEGAGGPRVVGRSQCVHLPGPGRYLLNGFGKVTSLMFDSNSARLRWELRYNGGALGCEDGAYNLTNTHILATTNTWRRPGSGAVIDVPEGVWTRNTSLTIKLDTIGAPASPPTAWFDGITLELDAIDTIFENGFD